MAPTEETISLPQLAQRACETGRLALDTEFVGEGHYWPQLCLVQFAIETPDGVAIAVVDTLAEHDPAPILPALADPGIEAVVHAGAQDLALLHRKWDVQVANVFDTQVAAAFLGANMQLSYQDALRRFLNIRSEKSEGFTHWDRRPLAPEQLAYAREDVEHLPSLARALREELERAGRLQWALDESRDADAIVDRRDPERLFQKFARSSKLDDEEATALRELVHWRDKTAREENRPLRSILSDQALTQLARRRPSATSKFRDIRGVHDGVARRYGKQIITVLREAEQLPPVRVDRPARPPEQTEPMVALAQAFIRARSQEAQIATELIATRTELAEVVGAILKGTEPSTAISRGWRHELVGQELTELLRGKRSLSVSEQGRLVSRPNNA